jgi:hypothetical protein
MRVVRWLKTGEPILAAMRVRLPPLSAAMSNVRRHTPRPDHGGEDNMTTSRISAVTIALSIAFGFVGGAGWTQGSAKDQKPIRHDRFFQTDGGR